MSEQIDSHVVAGDLKHVKWDQVPSEALNPLFARQLVVGTRVMVARLEMKKGCTVPLHSHSNEQVSFILSGALQFSIDGKEMVVSAGELLCIPPHLPHAAVALEDSSALTSLIPLAKTG